MIRLILSHRFQLKQAVRRAVQAGLGVVCCVVLAVSGCGTTPTPTATSARGISKHYVLLEYDGPITALAADGVTITDDNGAPLAIHGSVVDERGTSLYLRTDEQAAVKYNLVVTDRLDRTSHLELTGSTLTEPFVHSAVALDNTHVLLVFSASMLTETNAASIFDLNCDDAEDCRRTYSTEAGGLVIHSGVDGVAAQSLGIDYLPGGDATMAVLETTPQDNRTYTVTAANLKGANRVLIDPTRNSATFTGIALDDNVSPRIIRADSLTDTEILLSFNEPLAQDSVRSSYFAVDAATNQSPSCSNIFLLDARLTLANTQVTLLTNPQVAGCEYEIRVVARGVCATALGAVLGECGTDTPCPDSYVCQSLRTVTDVAGNPFDDAQPAVKLTFPGVPTLADGAALPRVVSAASLSNTEVLIAFNKSMGDSALDASNYVIVQANVNPEVGALRLLGDRCDGPSANPGISCDLACPDGSCALDTETCAGGTRDGESCDCPGGACTPGLRFSGPDRTSVIMDTMSQNEVTYMITAIDVRDQQGNQLAPPTLLADPRSATFAGTPPSGPAVDTDQDGLPDHEEQRGWIVTVVLADGNIVQREVTSDPLLPDTDGDGLMDANEKARMSDPRDADTDDDELPDKLETMLSSSPTNQDTDGEGLPDAFEARVFHTALYLADTDGDGFDDRREVLELNKNPRIADLPVLGITLGDLALRIDERFTDQETRSEVLSSSTSTTLERSEDSSFSRSDTSSMQRTMSGSIALSKEFGVKSGVKVDLSTTSGFTQGSTSQFDVQSSTSTKEAFERSLSKSQQFDTSVTREVVGASINSSVILENRSDIAFSLQNVEISALLPSRGRDRFVPIATMLPSAQLLTGTSPVYNLGPFEQKGPIIIANQEVFPNLVEDLMRDPRGVIFEVANSDVIDEFGRNAAFTQQEVVGRTVTLTIDYGAAEFERFAMAVTSVLENSGACTDALGNATGVSCDEQTPCPTGQYCGTVHGGFDGNGRLKPLPMDFVLQQVLGLEKNPTEPDAIVAGPNRRVDTIARGDDAQVRPFGEQGLDEQTVVINAGANGILDSLPNVGCTAGPEYDCDDLTSNTQGYETSPSCSADTPFRIHEPYAGGKGTCDTIAQGDDVQMVTFGDPAYPGQPLIGPGPNGRLDTVEGGDDLFQGPGIPCIASDGLSCGTLVACTGFDCRCANDQFDLLGYCTVNNPCPTGQFCIENAIGACTGPEVLVRFKDKRNGDRRRIWTVATTEELCNAPPIECERGIPVGGDFGDIPLRAGEGLSLSFEQDLDRDGVPARIEFMFGSKDREKDTDSETRDDGAEIYQGWEVLVAGQAAETVHSDPRFRDTDFDALDDAEEQRCATDPTRRDTDGDGIPDALESGLSYDLNLDCDISSGEIGYGRCCDGQGSCADGRGIFKPCLVIDHCIDAQGAPTERTCDDSNPCPTGQQCVNIDCFQEAPRTVCTPYSDSILEKSCCHPTSGCQFFIRGCICDDDCADIVIDDPFVCVTTSAPTLEFICPSGAASYAGLPLPDRLDPRNPDTDGDGIPDGLEFKLGLNPLNPYDADEHRDSDKDGLADNDEVRGWDVTVELCSNTCATSYDGTCDDSTSCPNGTDCADCEPRSSVRHVQSSPAVGDTDFDGLPDLLESILRSDADNPDTDGDGLDDFDEFAEFGRYEQFSFDYPGFTLIKGDSQELGTSLTAQDTDGDRLNDRFELVQGWRVLSRTDGSLLRFSDPLYVDSDLDGSTDRAEYLGKDGKPPSHPNDAGDATDPTDPDTDGDGRLDGEEINSNPLVPDLSGTIRVLESMLCVRTAEFQVDWIVEMWFRDPDTGVETPIWINTFACLRENYPLATACIAAPCFPRATYAWRLGPGCHIDDWTRQPYPQVPSAFRMQQGDNLVLEGRLAWIPQEFPFCVNDTTVNPSVPCISTFKKVISYDDLRAETFQIFEVEVDKEQIGAAGCANGSFTIEINID